MIVMFLLTVKDSLEFGRPTRRLFEIAKMPGHGGLTTVQLEAVSSPSVMLAASAWRACLISSSRLELSKPSNFRSR